MSQLFMILNAFPAQTGCLWPGSLLRSWNPIKNFYWYLQPCFSPVSPPWIFCHQRTKYYKSCYCQHYRTHRGPRPRVRSVFQKLSSETICWVCLQTGYRGGERLHTPTRMKNKTKKSVAHQQDVIEEKDNDERRKKSASQDPAFIPKCMADQFRWLYRLKEPNKPGALGIRQIKELLMSMISEMYREAL